MIPFWGDNLRQSIRRLARNDWFIVLALIVIAILVRWIFDVYHPRANGFFLYHGAPLSDGVSYTYKAINLANGNGIPPGQQPAIRPFYAIALACLYAWTGFSLKAVTVLNIVIGGATAGLIYLCGLSIFNRFCALGAALFFAIDPTQLIQMPQPCTEPLGLLFFVASVYAMVQAVEKRRGHFFLLAGILIGLSNLTRTLTLFALPFYVIVMLVLGVRERRFKRALLHACLLVIGFFLVVSPWLFRQHRLYGIISISDNIADALYAATSPVYRQWSSAVEQDADAAGLPRTIGDRYRYFVERAVQNVRNDPGFYIGNVSHALWEYVNTFAPRSRHAARYVNGASNVIAGQRILFFYLLLLIAAVWLLEKPRPLSLPGLAFLGSALGLVALYHSLPSSLGFAPLAAGTIISWRMERPLPVLIAFGSLATAIFGSAAFANPVLFRTILMTDWLFLFFLLAAIWYPAEIVSRRSANRSADISNDVPEEGRATHFQAALSSACKNLLVAFLLVTFGFFLVSATRVIVSTIRNRHAGKQAFWGTTSIPQRLVMQLSPKSQLDALRRLQTPPFSVVPPLEKNAAIYSGGTGAPQIGDYVVLVEGFLFSYYIPAFEIPRLRTVAIKPYPRTVVVLPQFDFIIQGELPDYFAARPVLFVGTVVPQDPDARSLTSHIQVRGIAVITLRDGKEPDFTRVFCAAPVL